MGFFSKYLKEKKEMAEMKKIFDQAQNRPTSVNYLFACAYLKEAVFKDDCKKYYLSMFDSDDFIIGFKTNVLNAIAYHKNVNIPQGYYFMEFKRITVDDNKLIVFCVPNPQYECDCNYVAILLSKDENIRYFTSEYYVSSNVFKLCEFWKTGRCSTNYDSNSFDEFVSAIKSYIAPKS